jgi:hypothetical protein
VLGCDGVEVVGEGIPAWPASLTPCVNRSSTAWQNGAGFGWAYTVSTLIDLTVLS